MRKWLRLGLCLGLLTVALTCSALAADGDFTTNKDGTVTYNEGTGKYTASYDGVMDGNQYALLVVKGDENSHPINEDTIMYIDQAQANGTSVSFEFIPKSTPDCVVLLGGEFGDGISPKILGTLIGQGVTVSGSVTSYNPGNPTTLELYTAGTTENPVATATIGVAAGNGQVTQNFELSSVPTGVTYDLKITKEGHTAYWLTGIRVDEDMTLTLEPALIAGDVDLNGSVNGLDLNLVTSSNNYGKTVGNATDKNADVNGDGNINGLDLNLVTSSSNYGKSEIKVVYSD